MINIIGDTLSKEEKLILVGFGTFQVVSKKARRGVNPQTRESIHMPAKNVPKFVPGKGLRQTIS